MKTKNYRIFIAIVISGLVFTSCQKEANQKPDLQSGSTNPNVYDAYKAPAHAPYNLDVILFGAGNNGGFIKFTQNPDTAKIINLHTFVGNLRPNHPYLLQRAVNAITDTTKCSSTAWLTLGEGLTPKSIATDINGNGNAFLWRDVSSVPSGTQVYIHFQVIDSTSLKVVLTSGCYQYTVR